MDKKTEIEKQVERNARWREKNPEKAKYSRYKSVARMFCRDYATEEDAETLKKLLDERLKNM